MWPVSAHVLTDNLLEMNVVDRFDHAVRVGKLLKVIDELRADMVGEDDDRKAILFNAVKEESPIGIAGDNKADIMRLLVTVNRGQLARAVSFGSKDGGANPGETSFINYEYFVFCHG